jgi:hypothetical protein
MKKKSVLAILSLVVSGMFISVIAILIWQGGYWENLPIFDRFSGPIRFRQFVTDPIPSYIYDIRGGYSGFPQGQIVTTFSFNQPPSEWSFLEKWNKSTDPQSERVSLLHNERLAVDEVFIFGNQKYFIAINRQEREALLYVP